MYIVFLGSQSCILFYTKLGRSEIAKIVEIELNVLRTKLNNMSMSLILYIPRRRASF